MRLLLIGAALLALASCTSGSNPACQSEPDCNACTGSGSCLFCFETNQCISTDAVCPGEIARRPDECVAARRVTPPDGGSR